MQSFSVTIASLIVLVAGLLGVGEIFPAEEVEEAVNAVTQIVGIVGVWYGRWRMGDITPVGFRK